MIKNGVDYNEYKLDILREFVGRKKLLKDSKKDNFSTFSEMLQNDNVQVNTYLATGKISRTVNTVNQLKDFLEKI